MTDDAPLDEPMEECFFCGEQYPRDSGYLFEHPNGRPECVSCRGKRLRREQEAERERALRRRGAGGEAGR